MKIKKKLNQVKYIIHYKVCYIYGNNNVSDTMVIMNFIRITIQSEVLSKQHLYVKHEILIFF